MTESCLKTMLDGFTAFGTVAVAIVAIWGDKIRAILAPSRLFIQLRSPFGEQALVKGLAGASVPGGLEFYYWHFRVVNERKWIPVQECRVLLTGIWKRGPGNEFYDTRLPVPLEFVWAPSEPERQRSRTVVRERILDFGFFRKGQDRFAPALYAYVASLDEHGYVRAGEAVRYYVEIDALNFASKRPAIFEVAWDGQFDSSSEKMQQHVQVREVPWDEAHPN